MQFNQHSNYGVQERRLSRFRGLSLFLVLAFLLQLIAPAAYAAPPQTDTARPSARSEAFHPAIQKLLPHVGRGVLGDGPAKQGLDGLLPDPTRQIAQNDSEDPKSESDDSEKPDTEKQDSDKPKRYEVPNWKPKAEGWDAWEPEAQQSPVESERPRQQQHHSEDQAFRVDHSTDSQTNCAITRGAAVKVVMPGEAAPPYEFSRQFNPTGDFLEMVKDAQDRPQAFSTDHRAYFTKAFDVKATTKEIIYDFKSPTAANNLTARGTAASCRYRYSQSGERTSSFDSSSILEITVWDEQHPSGTVVKRQNFQSHLCDLDCSVGVAARDLGVWTWDVTEDSTTTSQNFTVGNSHTCPSPGFARQNRVGALHGLAADSIKCYSQDQRLIYTQEYNLPEASQNKPKVSRTIHWSWLADSCGDRHKLTKFRSYSDVVTTYECTLNQGYTLTTKVFDQAYPNGRIYSVDQGPTCLGKICLNNGIGLPVGQYRFVDKVDGRTQISKRISVADVEREVTTRTGSIQPESGPTQFLLKLKCKGSFVPAAFNWSLKVKNAETDETLKTYAGQVRNNRSRDLTLSQYWDNTNDANEKVNLGVPVTTELTLDLDPVASITGRSAIAAAAAAVQVYEERDLGVTESNGTTGDVGDVLARQTIDIPSNSLSLGMRAGYGHNTGIIYRVRVDGNLVLTSGVLTAGQATSLTTIPITRGVHNVTIQAQTSPPGDYRPVFGPGGTWGGYLLLQYTPQPVEEVKKKTVKYQVEITRTECINNQLITRIETLIVEFFSSPIKVHVDPVSGLTQHAFTDLAVPTRGLPLAISRHHLSEAEGQAPRFGWNWSFQNQLFLDLNSGRIQHWLPSGQWEAYEKNGSVWAAVASHNTNKLVQIDNRHFEIRTKDKMVYQFEVPSQLNPLSIEARAVIHKEVDRNGNANTFHWDAKGKQLQKIEGPSPRQFIKLKWNDEAQQPAEVSDHTGRRVQYSYKNMPGTRYKILSDVIQPGGTTFRHEYDLNSGVKQAHLLKSWLNGVLQEKLVNCGPIGQMQEVTHRPNKTRTFKRTTEADGSAKSTISEFSAGEPERTVEIAADSMNRAVSAVDGAGSPAAKNLGGALDDNDNVISEIDALGHQTAMTYDNRRNLTSVTNAQGKTTLLEWSADDNLLAIVDPLRGRTEMAYDSHSNLIETKDPLQHKTHFRYNSFGKIVEITDNLGRSVKLGYNELGFLNKRSLPPSTSGAIAEWKFEVDSLGRRVSTRDPLGRVARSFYDERSRLVKSLAPAVTDSFRQESLPPAESRNIFDENDLLQKSIAPDGLITSYTYDSAHRLTKVQEPGKAAPSEIVYDGIDNVVEVRNAKGNATKYHYDSFRRVTSMEYPGGDSESYFYNPNSLVTQWNRGGQQVRYDYDSLNRLRSLDCDATFDHISWHHDDLGRVDSMTDNSGTTSYSYTDNYLLKSIVRPGGKSLSYTFDSVDRLVSSLDPEGVQTSYNYSNRDELLDVTRDGQTVRYDHDLVGRPTKIQYPNGVECRQNFDERNELLKREYVSNGSPLLTLKYAFNLIGQRVLDERLSPQGTVLKRFGYDNRRHLTSSRRQAGSQTSYHSYAYDDNDNMTLKDGVQQQLNVADQLTQSGSIQLGYNPAGQAINVSPKNISYNYNDQIRSATFSGTSVSMLYDGNGQRVAKTVNGQTSTYFWQGGEILKEYAPNGTVKADYLLGMGREGIKVNGAWKFYLKDIQGSTLGLVDAQGHVTDTYEYSDYGDTISRTGNSYNPFLYTGQELDAELGMYHLRARHYSPSLSRFIARDPIGHAGGSNLYAYCGGDPISHSDPSGLDYEGGYEYHTSSESEMAAWDHVHKVMNAFKDTVRAWAIGEVVVGTLGLGFDAYEAYTIGSLGRCESFVAGRLPGSNPKDYMSSEDFAIAQKAYGEIGITVRHNPLLGKGNGQFRPLSDSHAIIEFGDAVPTDWVFNHETGHAQYWLNVGYEKFRSTSKFQHELEAYAHTKPTVDPSLDEFARKYLMDYMK